MISDAYVHVDCDNCGDEEEISLCALAGGAYDLRDMPYKLRCIGWTQEGLWTYCEECSKQRRKGARHA